MQYIITVLLSLFGLAKKNSKMLFLLTLGWMWLLYTFNYKNADSDFYEIFYNRYGNLNIWYNDIEVGYQLICKFGNLLGLNYEGYLAIVSLFGLSLIGFTVVKMTNNVSLVASLYLIYPFMLDVVQQRNFLSMAVVIFGIRFLFSKQKGAAIYYSVCVLIASSFHYFSIFYILFLGARFLNLKKTLIYSTFAFLGLSIFIYFSDALWSILGLVITEEKTDVWAKISTASNKLGSLYNILEFLVRLTIVYLTYYLTRKLISGKKNTVSKKVISTNKSSKFSSVNLPELSEFVLKINIITVLLFPLFSIYSEVHRGIRTVMIINYILFAVMLGKEVKWRFKDKILYSIMIFIYVILNFILQIYLPFNDTVVKPIFEFNKLFN